MIPSSEFRARARVGLKNNWQYALLVAFIASMPGIISQVYATVSGNDYVTKLENLMLSYVQSSSSQDPVALLQSFVSSLDKTQVALTAAISLVCAAVTPALTLGMIHYLMRMLRGHEDPVHGVFGRMGCFLKAIGLELLTDLKIFLWALPGLALSLGGAVIAGWTGSVQVLYAFYTVGTGLAVVLGVMAMYRYRMAQYVQAERPDTGIMECIRQSRTIMLTRKMQLFVLELSFIGWVLLLYVIEVLLVSIVGSVIGSTVYMLLNLALSVYMDTAFCAFFAEYDTQARPDDDGDEGKQEA